MHHSTRSETPARTPSWTLAIVLALTVTLAVAAVSTRAQQRRTSATYGVDDFALIAAEARPGDWLSYGRTYKEQRYSPLDQITSENVDQLGIAWVYELGSKRGIEATPLVVDGVLYTTGAWSVVYALDVVTGEPLWTHDPDVPREVAQKACCDVVNRGAALYEGKILSGTLDGRLIALDAQTGELVWETQTVDPEQPYTITGAPRVVKGKVLIGNGGAEYGVRGYLSAYDADTGELVWRFYTVPGNPADGFENEAMEMAAKTWNGEWWKTGGGGTVWDSFTWDPELDLLYVGVGNGSPWNQNLRSPGGGDNLFISSIVALRPDTGEYVWHYQTTPGDTWDYTATQHIMLAELPIDGRVRKVLMQAPKNGFFYVLDRATGELISAKNYVTTTWASHVDPDTGRPVELPGARFVDETAVVFPGPLGGHNWHPMSYSPLTGLVYIPAQEMSNLYVPDLEYEHQEGQWNLGVTPAQAADVPDAVLEAIPGTTKETFEDPPAELVGTGHLLAWDPVAQEERWRFQYDVPWTGGTLATAGNLVFQGTPYGMLTAYDATSGEKLWESYTGSGVIAPPITFQVGDTQYVAIMSGWGGAFGVVGSRAARKAVESEGRVVVFALGARGEEIERQPDAEIQVTRVEHQSTPEMIAAGKTAYNRYCLVCHGYAAVGGNVITDLRQSIPRVYEFYDQIVLEGARVENGMPAFADVLDPQDVANIRAFVLDRRDRLYQEQQASGGGR
ncbi:MAG: PQQ-dependent dehydrogenase, methanol/ethanol family [Acidobacteria bacterium]|nr:MAG: PQQ-dependent dehydrogenase, methanol/ethanol family [Acidobacteriota bacterium]REK04620.1 MAG: PQQ-dependent dehydrogenase, methanol/ethanol family [Acidobacteriota bacterium]